MFCQNQSSETEVQTIRVSPKMFLNYINSKLYELQQNITNTRHQQEYELQQENEHEHTFQHIRSIDTIRTMRIFYEFHNFSQIAEMSVHFCDLSKDQKPP